MKLNTVLFTGKNLRQFLQAYTTSCWADQSVSAQWTAFLNAKGRVVTIAYIKLMDENAAYGVIPLAITPMLLAHLKPYLPFARVAFSQAEHELACSWSITQPTPWLSEQHTDHFTAHDLSLDVLGYLSFKKGCYLGQEIVARMHARITAHKHRLVLIASQKLPSDIDLLYQSNSLSLSVLSRDLFMSLTDCQVWDNIQTA
ncbi:tRNA-modifying protein YgfZ [bacterium]|jgi:hypothetical protein|nr:tRNA-modifying protein YgfZ [bacterium]NBW56559.1 tRNA-modifying protein YgfZ [bacterium]NBX72496.1 tRNA-modifying protein YgfZ [bacterium]